MNDKQIKWCKGKVDQMKQQIADKGELNDLDYEKVTEMVGKLVSKSKNNPEVRKYFFDHLLEQLDRESRDKG